MQLAHFTTKPTAKQTHLENAGCGQLHSAKPANEPDVQLPASERYPARRL